MIRNAFPSSSVHELMMYVRAASEQVSEGVCKAVKSHRSSCHVYHNPLPSLDDNSEIEEGERDLQEDNRKNVEDGEENRILEDVSTAT